MALIRANSGSGSSGGGDVELLTPKMSSASATEGSVFSSAYTGSYYAYYAFDMGFNSNNRYASATKEGCELGFHFTNPVCVKDVIVCF